MHKTHKDYISQRRKIPAVGGWRWAMPPTPEFCLGANAKPFCVLPDAFYPTRFTRRVLPDAFYPTRFTRRVLLDAFYPTRFTRRVLPDAFYPTRFTRRVLPDVFYPTRNLKFAFYPMRNPNASQWNIGCVVSLALCLCSWHVHFIFFVLISFELGSRRKRSFQ